MISFSIPNCSKSAINLYADAGDARHLAHLGRIYHRALVQVVYHLLRICRAAAQRLQLQLRLLCNLRMLSSVAMLVFAVSITPTRK
ncbi:MAG: hypothetical protein ABIW84_01930, partial [Ilumatobacteraceae bacterium]